MGKMNKALDKHIIIKIGNGFGDIIVDDEHDFLFDLDSSPYYTSEIVWWEYLPISKSHLTIGHGGPIDKNNSMYFWSETDYSNEFVADDTPDVILNYINLFKREHSAYNLIPSFTLSNR